LRLGPECGLCIFKWVYERIAPHVQKEERLELIEEVTNAVSRVVNPEANTGALCNRALEAVAAGMEMARPFYENFKEQSNERARGLLDAAKRFIDAGGTLREKLERACVLAAASNVAPLSAPSGVFTFPEAQEIMEGTRQGRVFGDVLATLEEARHVLYVADNAGEIGFDSFVIAMVKAMGCRVTLVVKQDPFFEDARMSDVAFFGLDKVVDEVVTMRGFLVPAEATPAVAAAYADCDVIIGKGTGAYEALRGETGGKTAIFLLKVKCAPIARETGTDMGTVVVRVEEGAGPDTKAVRRDNHTPITRG
jgi:damage-control phosphatase, subfamily I